MKFTNIIPVKNKKNLCRLLCATALSTCSMFTYAQQQQVHFSGSNITLKSAFQQIEKQTKLSVDYKSKDLNEKRVIKGLPLSGTVNQAIEQLLEGTDCAATYINGHIIIQKKSLSNQPKRTIKGKVVDDHGVPVVGANVVIKGTTNGTITDIEGNFSLEVTDGSTLLVTFIGYENYTVRVKKQKDLSIVLKEDRQSLDEVVVVGYGTAKKRDLAGSVVRADLTTLQESPSISLTESLQGTVPGLNVSSASHAGSSPAMTIRGRTSISGSNAPLIVLDGIIFRGSIVDINMNDVESVDVLKDASAAAIYGSQASNGVLLITTKQGKNMKKPILEYSGSYSFQSPTNKDMLPQNREGFLQKIADTFISESRIGEDLLQPNPNWDPSKYVHDYNAMLGYNDGADIDWWDLLTVDNAHVQSHNLSVRGKSDLSSYYFSVGYLDQQNLIVNDTYQRYNIRLNVDAKITNWLKTGVNSFFSLNDYSGVAPAMSEVLRLPPLARPTSENGELLKDPFAYFGNPLHDIQVDDKDKRCTLFANFFVDVNFPFLKGLNYRMNFSQNLVQSKHYGYNDWGNNYTGSAFKNHGSTYSYTVDNILTYKNTFGKHDINATFVYGVEERKSEGTQAGAKEFVNGALGYNKLDAGNPDLNTVSSSAWKEASLYMMFRAAYTFNNKYIFTGTVRRDGFSGFGTNNKYGVFPSAAVAWRVSEEDFIKDKVQWINNLKLRLSYGQNGNRTIGRYQTMSKMGARNGYLFGDGAPAEQMQWITSLPNSDLKWETTNTFNIGVDYSLFNNRLFGSIEYYRSQTNDLLYNISIPQVNGLGSIPTNIGKLANKGFEMTVTGIPVKTDDLTWDVTFNFSRNRNKVKSILGLDNNGDGKEDDLIANKIFIGHPFGVCYDYNIIGMWQVSDYNAGKIPAGFTYGTYKLEDVNGDGKYDVNNDRKILGYTDPAYRFSIQSSLNYKDWGLKFMINSIQGGKDYYYGTPCDGMANPENVYRMNAPQYDYWTPENPNARYRQLGYFSPQTGHQFGPYVQRSFVRLQDVTLTYNVPKSFLKYLKINRLKLYVTGKNLLTFTNWDGWDPETGSGLLGGYPVMKSYTFGLNVEF